jgi:hypothetical protein
VIVLDKKSMSARETHQQNRSSPYPNAINNNPKTGKEIAYNMLNDVKILPFAKIIPAAAKIAVSVHINENPNHTVMTIFENMKVVKTPSRMTPSAVSLNAPTNIGLKLLPKKGMTL